MTKKTLRQEIEEEFRENYLEYTEGEQDSFRVQGD